MKSLEKLKISLRRLPGIGPKQAERIAWHFLRSPEPETQALIASLLEAKERVRSCSVCANYAESEICPLCEDPGRDDGLLCVVEDPADVTAIERSRGYRGRYHVLHGTISPLDGVGPQALRAQALIERLKASSSRTSEVILATDPDTEGEATALYLLQALKPLPVKVTRIALGVPMGGDLDYVDERTLSSAMAGRREF